MINLPLHYSIHRDSNLTVRNPPTQFYPYCLIAHISYHKDTGEFQLGQNIDGVSKPRERIQKTLPSLNFNVTIRARLKVQAKNKLKKSRL